MIRKILDHFPNLRKFIRSVRNIRTRIIFIIYKYFNQKEVHYFRCNICACETYSPLEAVFDREIASCSYCGSSKRLRSIIAALSNEIFDEVIAIPDMNESKSVIGIGLSDAFTYSWMLEKKFSYVNTYYHKEPKLDITSFSNNAFSKADFIIASDVFEHIAPPVKIAFDNIFKLLKKDGVCIFSVPYKTTGETEEHFPDLFKYKIRKENGQYVLINKTSQGKSQVFHNLVFHGGEGDTLEMRLFSQTGLVQMIKNAGFAIIEFYDSSLPEIGVLMNENELSLVMVLRKT